jgi:hypothetical protein
VTRRVSAGAAEPVSGSKITSTSHLTVDQGIACPALTTPETEATIMPNPEFTMAPGTNNWMQDFAWTHSKTRSS